MNTDIETLIQAADQAYDAKKYLEAADQYKQAAEALRAAGDPLRAAEMDNNRCVAFLKAGEPQQAYDAAAGTDRLFAEAGDTIRQATAMANQGMALEDLKEFDSALELYEQAVEMLKEAGEDDMRSYIQERVSGIKFRSKQPVEGLMNMQFAIDNRQRRGWIAGPVVGFFVKNILRRLGLK